MFRKKKNEARRPSTPRRARGSSLPPMDPSDKHPEQWKGRQRGLFGNLIRLVLLLIVLLLVVLPFTPFAGKIKRGLSQLIDKARSNKVVYRDVEKEVEVSRDVVRDVVREVEVVREIPAPPTPLPSAFIPRKEVDVATLYNGITIQTKLESEQGGYASVERKDKDAFTVEFKLKLRVPKANSSLAELSGINDHLPKMLPGLQPLLSNNAKVSGFYHKLYDLKTSRVQQSLTRLNRVLDRHNFFDCETILELTHPTSQRRILLIQSDMDVVSDGSDGDRMPEMSTAITDSAYYQPSTSYEWAKKGKTANPLLAPWQTRLAAWKKEYGQRGLPAARNAELKSEIDRAERIITGLKTRSSLIAEKDPFIVLSLLFRGYPSTHPHAPGMGDYAAVIHGDKIYPAICGDYGPTFKMGEASLMVAKTINAKATPYVRPESDLKVTYLIFPGTAERPFGPPNLDHWHEKVTAYLAESGGLGDGYTLHKWENPFPPATPPAVEPATTPGTPETTPPGTTPPTTPAAADSAPAPTPAPVPATPPAAPTTPANNAG